MIDERAMIIDNDDNEVVKMSGVGWSFVRHSSFSLFSGGLENL